MKNDIKVKEIKDFILEENLGYSKKNECALKIAQYFDIDIFEANYFYELAHESFLYD